MAEGFLKTFDPSMEVYSGGTFPEARINPRAVQVMQEKGIDISGGKPSSVDEFIHEAFDYVITVCDNAKETCPIFTGKVGELLHIGFEDPAEAQGSEEEILTKFREIRDLIEQDFLIFYTKNIKES